MSKAAFIKNKNQLTLLFINVSMLLIVAAVAVFVLIFITRSLNAAISETLPQERGVTQFNIDKAKELGF